MKSPEERRDPLTLPELLRSLLDAHGRAAVDRVADAFGMSKTQLATTLGLSRESLYKAKRADAEKTQTRVREMLEVIVRVVPWAGGQGYAGLLTPSFAPGATESAHHLVLWKWGAELPTRVMVYDPSGRLPKDHLSWP